MNNVSSQSFIVQMIPFLLMILIFYFLLIRPQQKQLKERQKMLDSLKVGDKILSVGGIIGTISSINDDKIEVEIAKNIKVTMVKSAVTSVLNN
jgi:preprotein translocase subunit YajC